MLGVFCNIDDKLFEQGLSLADVIHCRTVFNQKFAVKKEELQRRFGIQGLDFPKRPSRGLRLAVCKGLFLFQQVLIRQNIIGQILGHRHPAIAKSQDEASQGKNRSHLRAPPAVGEIYM